MKKDFPFYVLLLAIYPILLAWSINVSLVSITYTARSFILVFFTTLLLLLLLKLLTKDWLKAGLITAFFIFSLLYYGYLIDTVQKWWSGSVFDLHRYAVSIIIALLIFGSWAVWRILKPGSLRTIQNALTAVVLILLLVPTYQIISYWIAHASIQPSEDKQTVTQQTNVQDGHDIYYIVLDEYTRDDVLIELFDYDNTPLLDSLREKGFVVPTDSRSNYSLTTASITSSMNMDYIQNLTDSVEQLDQNSVMQLLHNNRIRKIMEQKDYQFISFDSGYSPTQIRDADIYLSFDSKTINQFESVVLQNSLPGMVFAANLKYEIQRQRILYTFDQLAQIPNIPGEKFVFAHIVAPHPPFVFDAQGNKLSPSQHYTIGEKTDDGMSQEIYIEGYREQVQYINYLLEKSINEILAHSETPPIIIIQGDHGTRTYTDWESIENSCLKERMSIFNAYYFPDESNDIYDTISPVNTFRIMLNHYFDTELELLPDRSFFSPSYLLNSYVDITDDIEPFCVIGLTNDIE